MSANTINYSTHAAKTLEGLLTMILSVMFCGGDGFCDAIPSLPRHLLLSIPVASWVMEKIHRIILTTINNVWRQNLERKNFAD